MKLHDIPIEQFVILSDMEKMAIMGLLLHYRKTIPYEFGYFAEKKYHIHFRVGKTINSDASGWVVLAGDVLSYWADIARSKSRTPSDFKFSEHVKGGIVK